MESISVALIDDHKIVRQGLRELLEKLGGVRVTHEFDSGTEFLDALPIASPPKIFILDYSMPGLNGIEVLQQLESRDETYLVLLLTQHFDESIIDAAYQHGARGFLHKNCTAAELKYALTNIANVGYNNVTEILRRIRNYQQPVEKRETIELSAREMHFLTLVCDPRELTYDQMASEMEVSVKSIEAYRAALFERYQIKSKVGLVLFSFKHRLTEPFLA